MKVAIYLRKSRADEELEKLNTGETLAKHKTALLKLANERGFEIAKIYEEIVSGESLISRPEILKLLESVESKKYSAVLCMDIDRLGRGNMQEQGLILQTFKDSRTLIITPHKTYDLNNEFDEEYSEFEAFMARKELKLIKKRMQRGKIQCLEQGQWIASFPPFGYHKITKDKMKTLEIVPDQAQVVRMIYRMYTRENMGCGLIASRLNDMGFTTESGGMWTPNSVKVILSNPAYVGKVTWRKLTSTKKLTASGNKQKRRVRKDEWLLFDGIHAPIIEPEIWKEANEILDKRYHVPHNKDKPTTNPLAGLIICAKCERKMVRRPYGERPAHLICAYPSCDNKSNKIDEVEAAIITYVSNWLSDYKTGIQAQKTTNTASGDFDSQLMELNKRLSVAKGQKDKLHELLETGIYDNETFLTRNNFLVSQINEIESAIKNVTVASADQRDKKKTDFIIRKFESVLTALDKSSPAEKNILLKSILDNIYYAKEKNQKSGDFQIIVFPKVDI